MSERESPARPEGSVRASVSLLRRNRDFRRLFFASVISLGGDWFLFVAIGSLVYEATGRAISVGFVIVAQELPFFFASWFGGILADRMDRRKLMIACDAARAVVCVAFLLVSPERLWLAFALLALLSTFAGPYDPASSAATPNVVDPEDLPIANALNGSLWGTMLAVGAALGGIVAGVFGANTAFLVDAVSFVISALLLLGVHRPFSEERDVKEHPGPIEATRETVRYARRDRRVLALLVVKAGFGLAAGVLALIVVFAHEVFHAGTRGYGLLMAFRGLGALIGPFLGHRLAGPGHRRLFDAIAVALAVFGLSYITLGLMPSIWLGALTVLCAHLGGGAQWVLSTYGLQRLVPDRIRGRIFAADYAMITLTLTVSGLVAASLADAIGPREAVAIVGALALVWSAVWWSLTRKIGRNLALDPAPAETGAAAPAIAPP